ncbi:MAG TPA: glycosyltransferase family 1 protein [Acidimicrobiales bacterium]|nr:glycosyltransferase family 1 protein [Acidimicrobiales bacterium]
MTGPVLPGEPAGTVPLRVSLDVSAVPPSPAGAGRYTTELARALARRGDVELVAVARRGDAARWRGLAGVASRAAGATPRPDGTASRAAGADGIEVVEVAPRTRPARLAWEQLALPGLLDGLGPAVHHGPHYTMPERARVPVVVTVHDLTFFDHPEWHERSKVWLFRRAIRRACRRAAVVVCVSARTAERLAQVCPVSVPVVVAPHGVDLVTFRPDEPAPGHDEAALRSLGLDPGRPMVVFVGTLEPRKGVAGLVRAFDRVATTHSDVELVLAGQPGWGLDEVERALAAARHGDRVRRTGYVPDASVPALLRRAAVVAYPAVEEGYGLPALEALACGAALVTTSGTAMAELADGAALLTPPGDVDALAEAIGAALEAEGAARDERRRRGLAAAGRRTWDESAARHVAAYRQAAGSS